MNACFAWSDYRQIPLASYGLAAASVGFGAQMIVNGPLVLWWGKDQLSWAHYLILGPVCAVAQTLGKIAAVWLLLKIRPAGSPRICARYGLLVGLGFTLTEIAFLYFPAAWRQIPLGYLSLWERISVSGFHIYSAGLAALALALGRRGRWLILFVVAIHSLMDSIAPAGMSLGWPLYGLEAFISALAIMTWGVFLFAARPELLRRQWGFSEEETTDAK